MQITSDTTLTEDHNGQIVIIADDVTLDCDGYKVTGIGSGIGIDMNGRSGVTVRNCDVSGFAAGINLSLTDESLIEDNSVHDNVGGDFPCGIVVRNSPNNIVRNNVASRNGADGIHVISGVTPPDSDGNTIEGNTFTGNGRTNSDRFGILVAWSNNNTVRDNIASKNPGGGISLHYADSNSVYRNVTDDNGVVEDGNGAGIGLFGSNSNTVSDNEASGNALSGISVADGGNNVFTSNESHGNKEWGFTDWSEAADTFSENRCTGNLLGGSQPSGLCQEEPVGLVDTSSGMWHLRHSEGSGKSFYYGNPGDVPFMGDWNCNGEATPGLFRQSDAFAYLRNSNTQGIADIRFYFGNPSDIPLAGDFNGDGCDTLSIYRPSEARFYIINKLGENEGGLGAAEYSFLFGNPGDKPVVGDWDGDGIDEIGLHRETSGFFYYRNTLTTGIADGQFFFGDPGDRFVSGDWGVVDGVDTPAMFRPSNSTFYFRHTLTQGIADSQFVWTGAGSNWLPVSGEFTLD
jgi:parallel beta-helix repeat protein